MQNELKRIAIGASYTALATATAPDVANAWSEHVLSYTNTSSAPMVIYARCQARRASGNAWFDMDEYKGAGGGSGMWGSMWGR